MIRNYLITAIRFLKRNKLFAGINVLGLSIALASSFIILLFVINEYSFNTCFKNRKQVYRVLNYWDSFKLTSAQTSYVLAQSMSEEFSQVKNAVASIHIEGIQVKLNQEFIPVKEVIATDSEFFKIFQLKLIGQQNGILDQRNSIILSQKQSQKFFPDQDPVGKELDILINGKEEVFTVKGIFSNIPANSTLKADCFINSAWALDELNQRNEEWNAASDWNLDFWETWVLLNKDTNIALMGPQFRALEKKVFGEKDKHDFFIQNLTDVYLHSDHIDTTGIKGNLKNIRFFSAIALLVIIVAAFNYIILSTAVSTGRAKEIGIRKTNGASSGIIRKQVLNESVILAFMVFPFAIFLAWIGKPYAEELFQTKLLVIEKNIIVYLLVYVLLTLTIGLTSGLYTSFVLSKLNVISILKNKVQTGKHRSQFRTALIVIQIVIFCIFVSSSLIIRTQYKYALERDPGYNNKDILFVNVGLNPSRTQAFINSIKSYPNVISVGGSYETLPIRGGMPMVFQHLQDKTQKVNGQMLPVNKGFIESMGLTLLEGENFSWKPSNDEEVAMYANETAIKQLGITKPIGFSTDPLGQSLLGGRIVGVVKDFNVYSIHSEIPPLFYVIFDDFVKQVVVRYQTGTLESLLPLLKKEWNKIEKEEPFNYKTLKEYNKEFYAEEKNLNTIVSVFALFSLFIAAIGLFGLTLFVMKSQTKEIGIKRVFGSSEKGIISSFIKGNLVMVVFATLLSVPITLLIMNRWLNNFAFKTKISLWIFVFTFALALLVVLSTVLFHSYRASRINPVNALRYE